MNDLGIGKLRRVALREVWKHEAYDFTQWLQANIDVLNEALPFNLVNVEREQAAGVFSIDLVAEDDSNGKVIIENQLEKSNHDHLGKLITYLTAMNARAAIWIVSEPRPEHVAAMSWLNDNSSADFYLLKVEAVQIGDSAPAALMTMIVSPADDKSDVARTNREFAARHDIRHAWWSQLVKRPDAKLHAHITPSVQSWIGTSSGTRGLQLNYVITQDQCGAELYIDRGTDADDENKAIFDRLAMHRATIEAAFGGSLSWERLDTKRACRIKAFIPGGYKSPDEAWEGIQAQLVSAMNRLEAALRPHLQTLQLGK
ncbi:MAG: DUF4268 domain-containing protein [Pseudotabrizicola sp.]|uniref:DUF4268 domain-containing protein n=1 Tax=Pseudotabrizicola sp. TaxID=2939647 RepID=UPI002730CBB6|nr:DUF4268 domain-containing protein [Pseudotabrizicola sp.]MDP2081382.1 DUF4268 domain-containing protein [Pseudotabrizicola sp.]MDZ7575267.1 DUF4268 domain-containing protein [Pseudotabrizicola sp.]